MIEIKKLSNCDHSLSLACSTLSQFLSSWYHGRFFRSSMSFWKPWLFLRNLVKLQYGRQEFQCQRPGMVSGSKDFQWLLLPKLFLHWHIYLEAIDDVTTMAVVLGDEECSSCSRPRWRGPVLGYDILDDGQTVNFFHHEKSLFSHWSRVASTIIFREHLSLWQLIINVYLRLTILQEGATWSIRNNAKFLHPVQCRETCSLKRPLFWWKWWLCRCPSLSLYRPQSPSNDYTMSKTIFEKVW